MAHVLIVDDEPNMRWVLQEALTKAGYTPHAAASGEESLSLLSTQPIDLVILDLKLKGMDGLATLRQIHTRWPDVVVIILTAYGTIATAVEALQSGAADYLRKPFDIEEILFKIARALERRMLQQEVSRLRRAPPKEPPGSHPVWRRALAAATQAFAHGFDLRLIGEMGSGRATIGRYVYACSARHPAPLVELDLATVPSDRQAQVLEGMPPPRYEGAWTVAGQGVLLLRHTAALSDEGAMALERLRERRAHTTVGPLLILTSAPAETLPAPLSQSPFPFAEVQVPPLRDHMDDLLLLVAEMGYDTIAPTAVQMLHAYTWPGNIAELCGVLERAATLAQGEPIEERHLPTSVRAAPLPDAPIRLPPEGLNLEAVEISLIQQALKLAGGNKSRAAELLGLTRHTLLYRLEKYGIGET